MAYADSFYVKSNIIGYTGALMSYPTVYFRHDNRDGTCQHGRITQTHTNSLNVGRHQVSSATRYQILNEPGHNGIRAVERSDTGHSHTSRNQFYAVTQRNTKVIAELTKAIVQFPFLKKKFGVIELISERQDLVQQPEEDDVDEIPEEAWPEEVVAHGVLPSEGYSATPPISHFTVLIPRWHDARHPGGKGYMRSIEDHQDSQELYVAAQKDLRVEVTTEGCSQQFAKELFPWTIAGTWSNTDKGVQNRPPFAVQEVWRWRVRKLNWTEDSYMATPA